MVSANKEKNWISTTNPRGLDSKRVEEGGELCEKRAGRVKSERKGI